MPDGIPVAVEVVRSGGFAGIEKRAAADTGRLPPERAAQLRDLVRRADVATLARRIAQAGPDNRGRDRFQYDVEIRVGEDVHRFSSGEAAAPPELRSLIDAVLQFGDGR